ncbi:DeoR/GlpR transcriptional regulator [Streptomyces sp. SID13666]|uniref:DeoR/GlpR family DNA-binding transcription regulator n=1 Tax=unclassified Streptomyces TaxID=2593676 RepID=UPI0013BF55E8|nr:MULTISPECIES: DeoR/GlpR family DNA-binding transcription regulator [unclassified Streptomyces]NEA53672.1 DeoR/GlpR transcriptional regulator [Streptomyces sp. SID13666]NEA71450.1 DeoR/GlpR transcriptional regulator [Streptomyces sp. SID13588]
MSTANRLDVTLRLVQGAERMGVAELARRLGVSEMTVRRDLDELERQGMVRRVHGGAVAAGLPEQGSGFAAREPWQAATKDRLGAAVAELVEPGQTVLLDAGTTTVHVAGHLIARAPLTVAVLGLQAAVRLADQPGIRLLVLGGESRPGERSLIGPLALRAVDGLAFDCFVMSIGGVHADHGWSEFSLDDCAVKQTALARASRTVAVADATKLGVQAFSRVAPLNAVDTFVTDAAGDDPDTHPGGPATLAALRDAGVRTHLI